MPTTYRERDPDGNPVDGSGRSYRDGFTGAVTRGDLNHEQSPGDAEYVPRTAEAQGMASTPDSNGSGFVNWDQYFNANAQGAKNTANQLADTAGNAAFKANADINAGEQRFGQMASAASVNTGAVPTISGHLNQAYDPSAPLPNAGATDTGNPESNVPAAAPTPDPNTITEEEAAGRAKTPQFVPGSLLDAQFNGGGQKLSDEVTQAGEGVDALQKTEGRQVLLQKMGDNRGESVLDAALTGRAGGNSFRDLAQKYGGLGKALDAANSRTAALGTQTNQDRQGSAARYADAIEGKRKVDSKIAELQANGDWPPKNQAEKDLLVKSMGPYGYLMDLGIKGVDAEENERMKHAQYGNTFRGGASTAVIGGKHWEAPKK